MLNLNSGYVGSGRSVRSRMAIDDFEVPLSMITKSEVSQFIYENQEYAELSNLKISLWKYTAGIVGASSWHHTGKYFAKTDHYSIIEIADYLKKNISTIETDYKEYKQRIKEEKQEEKSDFKYIMLNSNAWSGSRRHSKIVDKVNDFGILIGNNAYDINGYRHNIYANRVNNFKTFNSYAELVKAYPEIKGTVKKFNNVIKNNGLKK